MLLLMITLTGCGKDGGSDGPIATPANSYLRGTADGIPFNATTLFVTFSNSGDDDITIRGDWPGGSQRMQVAQDPAIVAGVYPFESGKLRNATYFEVTSWNAGYMCGALPPASTTTAEARSGSMRSGHLVYAGSFSLREITASGLPAPLQTGFSISAEPPIDASFRLYPISADPAQDAA